MKYRLAGYDLERNTVKVVTRDYALCSMTGEKRKVLREQTTVTTPNTVQTQGNHTSVPLGRRIQKTMLLLHCSSTGY